MACVLAATFLLDEMLTKSASKDLSNWLEMLKVQEKTYQIPNVGKMSWRDTHNMSNGNTNDNILYVEQQLVPDKEE